MKTNYANDNPADDADAMEGNDTMPPAAEPDMDEAMGEPGEISVPIDALSEPDEQDQMTPPEIGDKGQASIEFTVSRVDGKNAYITLDAVNGTKVGSNAPVSDDEEMGQLQSMAQQMPQKY